MSEKRQLESILTAPLSSPTHRAALEEKFLAKFWFQVAPALGPGEKWLAHHPANRSQGLRAVGGSLHVSSQRVFFVPNVVDARLGGRPWSCDLADVAQFGVEPAHFALTELFSGGLRSRLRIGLRDGGREFFVVSSPAALAEALQAFVKP